MNWYKATLTMRSPSGTPWQADTIFGHLCWALRYLEGGKALADFLGWYDNGMPPLLVSNGFLGDLLPKPLIPPAPIPVNLSVAEQYRTFQQEKKVKGIAYLPPKQFEKALKGEPFDLESYEKDKAQYPGKQLPGFTTRATLKNQINRLIGTTGEGGQLFDFTEHFCERVTIYLKIEDGFVDTVKKLFDYLKDSGYGKRKSVGYGQIKDKSFDEFGGFDPPADANGFVSLSNFVPAESDPADGCWKVLVKYGKLSEGFAVEQNVFKKPLCMLEAGSAFYAETVKEYYGRLVRGLSRDHPEVVQYGYALPVPMHLPVEGKAKR